VQTDTLELLNSFGVEMSDVLLIARVLEDRRYRSGAALLIDCLFQGTANDQVALDALLLLAKEAEATRRKPDGHSEARDSNRSRRGMSDEAWRALRQEIFERDRHECQYCGASEDLTCDHILPLMRGGTNDHDNLNTACRSCNSRKGTKTLAEWLGAPQ
jgi:hypothetical protein